MTAFTPDLICRGAVPGVSGGQTVWLTELPAAATVITPRIEGFPPFVHVAEVIVSRTSWRHLTNEELMGIPAGPAREAARLHTFAKETQLRLETVGAAPVLVAPDDEVQVVLGWSPPADASEGWQEGRLVVSPVGEVPLLLAVGAEANVPTVSPDEVRVTMGPGETKNSAVLISKAPSRAYLRAGLISSNPTIRATEINVFRQVVLSITEARALGLLDGLSVEELDQIRDHGWAGQIEVARGPGTTPVDVWRDDEVWVWVEFVSPPGMGGPADAELALVAPQWKPVNLHINATVESVGVTLAEDTFAIGQGGMVDLTVTLASGLGAGGVVTFGIDGADGILSVPLARLSYEPRARRTVRIPLSVAPAAPIGPLRNIGLVASFNDGASTQRCDLHVDVVPALTDVWATPFALAIPAGGSGSLTVTVDSAGGDRMIRLEPFRLPPGVSMESATLQLGPADPPKQCVLTVDVHPDALPATGLPLGIAWNSNNGQQTGSAASQLTIFQRPESRTFSAAVVTPAGVPLGGRVEFEVHSDGSARFRGYMRATGAFSYSFTVRAVLRSRSGAVALMEQKSGSVYGSDALGRPRQFDWDEDASRQIIADTWPDVRSGSIQVSRSSDMIGFFGSVAELVGDVLEFAVTSAVLLPLGPAGELLACLAFAGSELGGITDTSVIGPGGLSGLVVAGGVAFLLGPTLIIPAFVGGVLIGETLVKHRGLNATERAAAQELFRDTLPWDKIRLTNLSGQDGQAFTTPSIDGTILVNVGVAFDSPLTSVDPPKGYPVPGQVLMHELTHAWQIAHKSFKSEYFWKAAVDKMGGRASYRYGPPGPPWRTFGLEAQASLVEGWWAGRLEKSVGGFPPGATKRAQKSETDPYFRYVSENIRMGEPL